MEIQLTLAKQELKQAQKSIAQFKVMGTAYYANINADKIAKESRQMEILGAQTRAAEAQTRAAEAEVTGISLEFQAFVGGAYLRDGPLSRFQALIVKKPNLTWEELRSDLLSAHEPANLADLNYIRLGELSQVSCPTLADFVDKFTRLESQLPLLPESFKISIFVKNWKMEIKEKLLSNIPNTNNITIVLGMFFGEKSNFTLLWGVIFYIRYLIFLVGIEKLDPWLKYFSLY